MSLLHLQDDRPVSNVGMTANVYTACPAWSVEAVPLSPIDIVLDGQDLNVWAYDRAFSDRYRGLGQWIIAKIYVAVDEGCLRNPDIAVIDVEGALDHWRTVRELCCAVRIRLGESVRPMVSFGPSTMY